jgi:hypothetical protein
MQRNHDPWSNMLDAPCHCENPVRSEGDEAISWGTLHACSHSHGASAPFSHLSLWSGRGEMRKKLSLKERDEASAGHE